MEIIKVILTTLLSALALFIIAKIMGHKQMSQLGFFDYITGITIGSVAAELATEIEEPMKPLIAMVVYGAVTFLLSLLTSKVAKARKYINGTPTIIMNNGKIYRDNMKKAKLDLSEFMVLCRQEGYFDLADIHTAVFEYNGRLTVLPVSYKRPATPNDLNISVENSHISTEIILDGKVLNENLKRKGLDKTWLNRHLKAMGYNNAKEVFLAVCDENNNLTIYECE